VPFDPATGAMVGGDIAVQTRRVLDNIGALLKSGGLTHADVVRTTVFLADMDDFVAMNEVYRAYFSEPYPARSTVQAARLPRDARIEIDAIAMYETQS
jgi:2-iminobutanoate/2-iminopropanoate deaminase